MKPPVPVEPTQLAFDAATNVGEGWGNRLAAIVSAIALTVSGFTLWDTSLKSPDVRVFVPATIHYSNPSGPNSNFEVISIPVTITNEGARTGTVLAIELDVSDGTSPGVKRFYAADIGRWSMERTRAMAYQHFAPMNLPGRASRTENILFYPKGDAEQPIQVVRDGVDVRFTLRLDMAEEEPGWFDRILKFAPAPAPSVTFARKLRFYDARAFNQGTIPMDAKDWKPARSGL